MDYIRQDSPVWSPLGRRTGDTPQHHQEVPDQCVCCLEYVHIGAVEESCSSHANDHGHAQFSRQGDRYFS